MADPNDTANGRIDNLEMRIAYQDEAIDALNKSVIEQWATLDRALGRIKQLEARLQEDQASNIRAPGDETPPPHY